MWTREYLKNEAKEFLKKYYWKALLVCLIVVIVGIGSNELRISKTSSISHSGVRDIPSDQVSVELANPILKIIIEKISGITTIYIPKSLYFSMTIITIIISIFIVYTLKVGKCRFFIRGLQGNVNIKNLYSAFKSGEYLRTLKTGLLKGIYIILWSLIFIIPEIIKFYEYYFVPYILSEEPNLSPSEVIERSRELTDGHKLDIFLLELSFLGWNLLGLLLLGFGTIFVDPYREATVARLYLKLTEDNNIVEEY